MLSRQCLMAISKRRQTALHSVAVVPVQGEPRVPKMCNPNAHDTRGAFLTVVLGAPAILEYKTNWPGVSLAGHGSVEAGLWPERLAHPSYTCTTCTGTGKTKTILGLLSVLACAVPADSPQLLRAAGAGGAASPLAEAAAPPPTRRALTARASPWLVRSARSLRFFLCVFFFPAALCGRCRLVYVCC